jgi:hypothetical protein
MYSRSRAAHVLRIAIAAMLAIFVSGAQNETAKSRHAAILARILAYELSLEDRAGDSVGVVIVYLPGDPISKANADGWLQAFHDLAPINVAHRPLVVDAMPFAPTDLEAAIDRGADVLLAADGLDAEIPRIARIARSKHVLTAGNATDYVQTELTVCVTQENEKTKILINLRAANLEQIRFSSRLLALATLIR